MSKIPEYEEINVAEDLSEFVNRFLKLEFPLEESIRIPARPTGHVYLGLLAQGKALAVAEAKSFEAHGGQLHLSGQLAAFDAEYELVGPVVHYLAEFTPTGAYRLFGRDMDEIINQMEVSSEFVGVPTDFTCFENHLRELAKAAGPEQHRVAQAAQLIDENRGNIRVVELADQIGLSERQLRRDFTKIVGIPPKPYAMIKRVLAALQLLAQNPDLDMADLVFEAGFSDQPHLIRVFQLYLRATPSKLQLDADGVLKSIVAGA